MYLHPSAQAALGSLFCQVAGPRHQLIVETHSDHLMDRVRMDVRDGVSGLKPEDVSILFFERRGLDVRIHSLRIDKEGNVLDAPDGYRQFFMDEMSRSLWPERSTEEAWSMCAIIDTNVVHEVFGSSDEQPAGAGEGFFRWLSSGKGKLVVGGKLKEEIGRVSNYRIWAQQATLSGKLINKSKDRIDQETKRIKNGSDLQSDARTLSSWHR